MPFQMLGSPLWGMQPEQIAWLTDYQIEHLYITPFTQAVSQIIDMVAGRNRPTATEPTFRGTPEQLKPGEYVSLEQMPYWSKLVENLERAGKPWPQAVSEANRVYEGLARERAAQPKKEG